MKIYGINGGPRKGWNTDTMMQKFLEGAASVDSSIETEMVYLYNLNYKGCISCFACQRDSEATYGQCQVKDDIYQLLRDVPQADGVVFGCPVYLHDQTAELRAFVERLVYQFLSFEKGNHSNNAPKKLETATIYTMNVTEESAQRSGYDITLGSMEVYLRSIFHTTPERICAYNTYQFKDYAKYRADYWNEPQKAEHHRTQFPVDCQRAYEAGARMAQRILAERGQA